MKKSRFTESQIVGILKEIESGLGVESVCRSDGVSKQTYYTWKQKYGGLEISDVKRLKELETENAKLKKMYAEMALENHALKDVIAKKLYPPMPNKKLHFMWCKSTNLASRMRVGWHKYHALSFIIRR